jgi:nucleotide-binding universal stress UspA family protein
MSEENDVEQGQIKIRRILVAIDASTDSLAALEVAAQLAASAHARLMGLFVEDINLLRLAGLPFAREIRWPTAAGRRLDSEKIERDLRLRASQARRALAGAAEKAEAEWSFQVVRGIVSQEIINAALEADLLSLGRASHSLSKYPRLGSTAQAAAAHSQSAVFLARRGVDLQKPIAVTFDGTESGVRSLSAAIQMAQMNDANLTVFVMSDDVEAASQLAGKANEIIGPRVAHANYRHLPSGDRKAFMEALDAEQCGIVILGGDSPILHGDALAELLRELDCPVMLVR